MGARNTSGPRKRFRGPSDPVLVAIDDARIEQGYTVYQFCERVGIAHSTYTYMMQGKGTSWLMVRDCANALGLDLTVKPKATNHHRGNNAGCVHA